MNWLYYIICLIIISITFIYIYIKYQLNYWSKRQIKHIKPRFFYGNLSGQFFEDIEFTYQKLKTHSPYYGFYVLLRPALVITDLDLIKTILIKDFDCFHDRGSYYNIKDDPLSGNLLNLDGDKWTYIRHKLTPTFSSGKIKLMFENVINLGNQLNQTIQNLIEMNQNENMENCNYVEINIKELMARYSTDVIGNCAFGIECNSLNDINSIFYQIGKEIFIPNTRHVIIRQLCRNYPNLARRLHIKLTRTKHINFFQKLVEQTIQYRQCNNIKCNDFLDLLYELKENSTNIDEFNFTDILANVFVFFAAGYETSSSLMTFTLYEFAQNLDIQTKCRTEIQKILQKYNQQLTYEALNEMTYLDQVINETLRLHCPVPIISRLANRDYQIPNTNFILEKGIAAIIPIHQIHLDPNYYENPYKFNPDNFLPNQIAKRHPLAFMPFGGGPRHCIGVRFAKMESKIGLILLLQNYQVENSINTKVPIHIDGKSLIVRQPNELLLNIKKLD